MTTGLLVFAAHASACSGCGLEIERSETVQAGGLFRELIVGAAADERAFVVALRETEAGEEATVVSLEDSRSCSLGPAIGYDTRRQSRWADVDSRPARIVTIEKQPADDHGTLHVFDAQCNELLTVPSIDPSIEIPARYRFELIWPNLEAYVMRTTSGEVLWIDPWAASTRTLAKNVASFRRIHDMFWLLESGALVVRDRNGDLLASAGTAVSEFDISPHDDEAAFVDQGKLFVLPKSGAAPIEIPTAGVPCKPRYLWTTPPTLSFLEDCSIGTLSVLDRTTGTRRSFSSGVTYATSRSQTDGSWIFFVRDNDAGSGRELFAVPPGGADPLFVGVDPFSFIMLKSKDGFVVLLEYDGDTGTLGEWTPAGGFSPLLHGVGWSEYQVRDGNIYALSDMNGEVGTLVALDENTHASVIQIDRVHRRSWQFASQAPALGYVHAWDDALGAGSLEAWIPEYDQRIAIDDGVSEFRELVLPEPGVVYAVRTPGREGIWTAFARF